MTGLALALLLQASAVAAAPSTQGGADLDAVTVTAPGPASIWCVRFPDTRSRRARDSMQCRTLAEWDAVRRTRYDSRGYQALLALRRFGSQIDSSLLEEASQGRVRSAMAARQVARQAGERTTAPVR